ncbi:MAG: DUF2283 domain-containing protein [Thermoproteota archaeon]
MRFRYDGEGDVLDILIRDKQIHRAEEYDQLIINYDEEDKVVEIEILNASKVLGNVLTEVLKVPEKKVVEIA